MSPHWHTGWGSRVNKYVWVNRVCPILSLVSTTSSILVLLWLDGHSSILGFILLSLLLGISSHDLCHWVLISLAIQGLKSWGVHILRWATLSWSRGIIDKGSLAAWSTASLPPMPQWEGHHISLTYFPTAFRSLHAEWIWEMIRQEK
jgi:hypothetical protein